MSPRHEPPKHDKRSPRTHRITTQARLTAALNSGLGLVCFLCLFNVTHTCGTTFQRYGKGTEKIKSLLPGSPALLSREHRITWVLWLLQKIFYPYTEIKLLPFMK